MKAKFEKATPGQLALRHPDARACSVDGRVFAADEKGVFWVPPEAVARLSAHGFTSVPEAPAADAE